MAGAGVEVGLGPVGRPRDGQTCGQTGQRLSGTLQKWADSCSRLKHREGHQQRLCCLSEARQGVGIKRMW